ncbi:hypothetical protein AOLI_G00091310 [Acnodon oligacanthus]
MRKTGTGTFKLDLGASKEERRGSSHLVGEQRLEEQFDGSLDASLKGISFSRSSIASFLIVVLGFILIFGIKPRNWSSSPPSPGNIAGKLGRGKQEQPERSPRGAALEEASGEPGSARGDLSFKVENAASEAFTCCRCLPPRSWAQETDEASLGSSCIVTGSGAPPALVPPACWSGDGGCSDFSACLELWRLLTR